MAKVHIYRPLNDWPAGTLIGDLEVGKVHTIDEKLVERYAKKSFVVLTDEQAAAVRAGKPLDAPKEAQRTKRESKPAVTTAGGQ